MEHRPTDTPLPSEASYQSPLPSMDERTPQLSLFGLTSVLEVIAALATACAQPRGHGGSGNEVAGASGAAPGSREAVGRWGKEMEELATEVVRSLQERSGAMEKLEELRKKEESLAEEYERLSKEYGKVFAEARREGAAGSRWDEVDRMTDRFREMADEEAEMEAEVERVGMLFDSMEREAEKLVVTLAARVIDGGQWMGTGARRSVAAAGGVGAGVEVEPPASHQSPPTAAPAMDGRSPRLSLFGVTSVLEVITALATACAQPRDHEESGDGVAGAAPGSRAAVGRWEKEMDELAAGVMRSLQERRQAMEELEQLRKKKQRLVAEDEELSAEYEGMFTEAIEQGPGSLLQDELDRMFDRCREIVDEQKETEVEVERVGKVFDSAEQEVEKLVVTLAALVIDGGQWMRTGARRSVAAAGGVGAGVKVEVDDVKVETECAEDAARD